MRKFICIFISFLIATNALAQSVSHGSSLSEQRTSVLLMRKSKVNTICGYSALVLGSAIVGLGMYAGKEISIFEEDKMWPPLGIVAVGGLVALSSIHFFKKGNANRRQGKLTIIPDVRRLDNPFAGFALGLSVNINMR